MRGRSFTQMLAKADVLAKAIKGGLVALAVSSVVLCALPSEARAASPYLEIPDPSAVMQTPAYRYANMTDDEAYAELDKRKIIYSRVGLVTGVRAPIRLTGRLHGVLIRSALPPEERASSIFEICDARLALALDDFTQILAKHDIEEVVHYTMYRPNVPPPGSVAAGRSDAVADSKADGDSRGGRTTGRGRSSKPGKRRSTDGAAGRGPLEKGSLDKGTKNAKPHSSLAPNVPGGDSKHKDFDDTDGTSQKRDLTVPAAFHFDAADGGGGSLAKAPGSKGTAPTGRRASVPPSHSRPSASPGKGAIKGTLPRKPLAASFDDDHPHGTYAPPGTRHPAGLAIDVGSFTKKNGKVLSVGSHFMGKIGDKTCGVGAPSPESEEAKELRSIVCEAHDAGVFTYALTPNFNAAHRDHFHMEIKPGVLWFLYN